MKVLAFVRDEGAGPHQSRTKEDQHNTSQWGNYPPNRGSRVMESLNEVVSEINHPILYFNFAVGHVGELRVVGDNDESVSEVLP